MFRQTGFSIEHIPHQDLLDYVGSFKGESSTEGHHPAALVAEVFGSSSAEHNLLHCQQLESWYQEYATNVRKAPYLYKKAESVVSRLYLQ